MAPEWFVVSLSNYLSHVLTDRTTFDAAHQRYFRVDSLKELLENVNPRNIVFF